MDKQTLNSLPKLLETIGLDEEPMGIFYTDTKPVEGLSPEPMGLPTREKEMKGEIDWQTIFDRFSCAVGHIRRARTGKTAAYFSAEQFGCPGAAFWLGFMKPQTEAIIHYVSTGVPNWVDGEFYCDSPDEFRRILEYVDPEPAPGRYCVVKPLGNFAEDEEAELVVFFARPESMCGLHQLAAFVTNDPEVVVSPWSASCGSLVAWPLRYLAKGEKKVVLGGWDPSARKFFRTDELSLTVPFDIFRDMVNRFGESFLKTKTWSTVQKKIKQSKKKWEKK